MVRTENTIILVDVGISGKKIFERLETMEIYPEDIDGILITHEHVDHIRSLRIVSKKGTKAKAYSNISTWEHIKELVAEEKQILFETGKSFVIGDIEVKPFEISHDADEPVGFSLHKEGKQVSIITDTGHIDEKMFQEIKGADILILEANHDEDVLQYSSYPYHIKRRIKSDEGHLSNIAAGACISRLAKEIEKKRTVLLSHLSKENNTPEMAHITIKNILEDCGIVEGEYLEIFVLHRDKRSIIYQV